MQSQLQHPPLWRVLRTALSNSMWRRALDTDEIAYLTTGAGA